jgi:mRNA interferase MazF
MKKQDNVSPFKQEIWQVNLGDLPNTNGKNETIGREIAKTRPCVIISVIGFSKICWVVPLTSKNNQLPFNVEIPRQKTILTEKNPSFALCHQLRSISFDRLVKKVCLLPEQNFNEIIHTIETILKA